MCLLILETQKLGIKFEEFCGNNCFFGAKPLANEN